MQIFQNRHKGKFLERIERCVEIKAEGYRLKAEL